MEKKQIADKLRALRMLQQPDRLKFTQKSGFSKQVVENIEAGGSVLSVPRLEKYLKTFGLKLSTFFLLLENEIEGGEPTPSSPIPGFEVFYTNLGRIILHADPETRNGAGKVLAAIADSCDPPNGPIKNTNAQTEGNIASLERKKASQGRRRA